MFVHVSATELELALDTNLELLENYVLFARARALLTSLALLDDDSKWRGWNASGFESEFVDRDILPRPRRVCNWLFARDTVYWSMIRRI